MLGFVGIAGFGLSNGTGIAVVALAQLPDTAAAFATASAISAAGPLMVVSTVGMITEIAGELGLLLLLAGLWRARLVPPWPLVLGILGTAVNAVIGTLTSTLIADVLLLSAAVWVALLLARAPHGAWLGEARAVRSASPRQAVRA